MKKFLIGLALLPLAGCISFGAKPPESLLSLTAAEQVPVGQAQSSAGARTVTIQVPAVPQALANNRIPVQASATDIAYVKDAQWVEPPARQFARLLSDTVTARTGRVVLSGAQSLADPGARLAGELRMFGVDAATSNAVVTYDAALVRDEGGALEKRRFEARVAVSAIEPAPVGVALNQAANQVAGEVADWIGR
ncbi:MULTISPECIES: ABC-type transport auxiliary lipoprotein family protein [unclassified Sphingomonas]|uniref:ABC-type transport auxiliary lipoprotein family protein n=1 Tax=unclassified Sphingomonas TaxID=196159 RepID=UPI001D127214|nr:MULTISPECIES: ABC-type transport auxiliary lipoprotein family protein [unclassified Sphingomonas]MCC2980566.1 ABC-type transport auxiliary lipoprotein family protein [Sphingomonas sp. IC4-52]MCD2316325.1 ABC-type transport auxiliary lipoprotein family protein [Sphingomonas sp. IC-11]